MVYTPKTWADGELITAEDLNRIEQGVDATDAALDGKVDSTDSRLTDSRTPTEHTHDDRYYTEAEVDALLTQRLAALAYDSGWRDVSSGLLGGTAGVLHIRRIGPQVYWRIKNYVAGTAHSFYEPPIGFRAVTDAHVYPAGQGQVGTSFYRHMNGRLTRSIYDPPVTQGVWFESSYALPPGTAIPVTPPGSNT